MSYLKNLTDTVNLIVNGDDQSKAAQFDLSGATTGKTVTLAFPHTNDRTLTFPDATDTLVGKATSDVLTNKKLSDASTQVVDDGDNTKALIFSLGGATTGKVATLISSHTNDRSITLPDATDTLVGKATTDTLTNKTVDTPVIRKFDGWLSGSATWTYGSATTFDAGADAAYMSVGDRIKLTQTTVKYFVIIGISGTTITVTGGTDYSLANAAITNPFYSHDASPVGYPDWFNYTPTVTAQTGTFTSTTPTARFRVIGRTCQYVSRVAVSDAGTAAAETRLTLPIAASASAIADNTVGVGQETFNTGDALIGRISTTTRLAIRNYVNGFDGATNSIQNMNISYEI